MRVDVLVVGAGPAGSTLSLLLARAGLDVLMVDSKKAIGKRSCSGILGMRCLKELPVNADPFVISEIRKGIFRSPGGIEIRVEGDIARVVDRVLLDRESVDASLAEGARILMGHRFVGIDDGKAIVKGESGSRSISFKYLVGADGVYSKVREVLNLKAQEPYIGVQVTSREGISLDDGFIVKIMRGSRFLWIYPWGDKCRVGALGRRTDPVIEWVQRAMPCFEEKIVAAIPSAPLRRFQRGNIALVGDASGQVKPLSRGGVYLGVKGAKFLANSIVKSYEMDLPYIESSYERRWWSTFGFEIKAGLALRRALDDMSPKELDSLFNSLKNFEGKISFDIDYQIISTLKSVKIWDILRTSFMAPRFILKHLGALIAHLLLYS